MEDASLSSSCSVMNMLKMLILFFSRNFLAVAIDVTYIYANWTVFSVI